VGRACSINLRIFASIEDRDVAVLRHLEGPRIRNGIAGAQALDAIAQNAAGNFTDECAGLSKAVEKQIAGGIGCPFPRIVDDGRRTVVRRREYLDAAR
jgi:hypothetical protein